MANESLRNVLRIPGELMLHNVQQEFALFGGSLELTAGGDSLCQLAALFVGRMEMVLGIDLTRIDLRS